MKGYERKCSGGGGGIKNFGIEHKCTKNNFTKIEDFLTINYKKLT